jgi:hypothetical protein
MSIRAQAIHSSDACVHEKQNSVLRRDLISVDNGSCRRTCGKVLVRRLALKPTGRAIAADIAITLKKDIELS